MRGCLSAVERTNVLGTCLFTHTRRCQAVAATGPRSLLVFRRRRRGAEGAPPRAPSPCVGSLCEQPRGRGDERPSLLSSVCTAGATGSWTTDRSYQADLSIPDHGKQLEGIPRSYQAGLFSRTMPSPASAAADPETIQPSATWVRDGGGHGHADAAECRLHVPRVRAGDGPAGDEHDGRLLLHGAA